MLKEEEISNFSNEFSETRQPKTNKVIFTLKCMAWSFLGASVLDIAIVLSYIAAHEDISSDNYARLRGFAYSGFIVSALSILALSVLNKGKDCAPSFWGKKKEKEEDISPIITAELN